MTAQGTAGSCASLTIVTRRDAWEAAMLKIIGWIAGIIFLIGLLVVFGIFDLIF